MWILTKEAVTGVVRTVMPYLYALLLGQLPFINSFLVDNGWSEAAQGFVSGGFVLVVGTFVYGAIRWAAEKYPQLGVLLVFNTKPSYEAP
jgi:hypothetical protein